MRQTVQETEALKLLILKKAEEVFISKGYAQTKMEDIALAAGTTRGPLYYHFSNKLELFNTVVTAKCLRQYEITSEIFKSDKTLFEKIYLDLRCIVNEDQSKFDAMLQHAILVQEEVLRTAKSVQQEMIRRLFDLKIEAARQAVESGELKATTDIRKLVNIIMCSYSMFSKDYKDALESTQSPKERLTNEELLEYVMSSIKHEFFN